MKKWGLLRVGAVLAAFTLITFLYMTDEPWMHITMQNSVQPDWDAFLVQGPNCRIRNTDPFHDSIKEFLEPTTPVICSLNPPLSKVVQQQDGKNTLVIDQGLLNKYKLYSSHRIECCYSIISRISQNLSNYSADADRQYRVSNCEKINKKAVLKNTTEFLIVKCQSVAKKQKRGKYVYENAHALVPMLPKLKEKLVKMEKFDIETKNISQERLSVLIIGIDSVSRLSLRRTMPFSLKYFEKNGWFELDGYNKIADNTFPNLMAILSGKTVEQVHKECMMEKAPKMDGCSIIWKDFQRNGYVTAYAEDVPSLATFNYRMTGFVDQPTDYYMRPFMLASHALVPYKNKDALPICIGAESSADHIFNYAKDFANTFENNPFFGLFWLNSFSHNNVNSPAALDLRLLKLLQDLQEIGSYNKTIVVVLSDHGIRFGNIRKTFVGFLEERLPFIFMSVPKNILEKYPNISKNLLTNRHRLTSPYDVHATLQQILGNEVNIPEGCPKCKTLFEEVPNDRKCEDAGIDPHWCMCPEFHMVPKTDPLVEEVGKFLFQRIINRTKELTKSEKVNPAFCVQREFGEIERVHESKSYDTAMNGATNIAIFVIVIRTKPAGMFEATIQANLTSNAEPRFQVLGFISRLDSYFATTKCVQSKMLQFYCHCFDAL